MKSWVFIKLFLGGFYSKCPTSAYIFNMGDTSGNQISIPVLCSVCACVCVICRSLPFFACLSSSTHHSCLFLFLYLSFISSPLFLCFSLSPLGGTQDWWSGLNWDIKWLGSGCISDCDVLLQWSRMFPPSFQFQYEPIQPHSATKTISLYKSSGFTSNTK